MKKIVLYLLFALLLVGCGNQPKTLSELKSEYATIDDSIHIHYKIWNESAGSDAKTICFVHGFGCDMNTWEKQFEAFRDNKNLQLVFIDLPGYGQSDKPHVEYTLDFFAHAIDEVLNANGIKDAVFVGHSLGTPVCRQTLMATGHKGTLVDVDGVYCFYDGTETLEYVEAVNQFGHAFDGPECRDVITGFVSSLAGKETPQEINDYAMSVMPETPQYVASSTMQHLVERKWWTNRRISQPVMVICTQNSGLDPDNKQKMQRLYPNLDYTELTTCGHFIHMEQPEMFNDKLKAFIASQMLNKQAALNEAYKLGLSI
ncbi:MAG: alpha/beta hydrolase [Prevotella sp.]|nr:alpha/beta hydrolase [Prevotella sp.]